MARGKVQCANCEATLMRRVNKSGTYFCDSSCSGAWQVRTGARIGRNSPRWAGRVLVPCSNCGASLVRAPKQVRKTNFCNFECLGQWRQRRVEVECAYCGKSLSRKPFKVKEYTHHFCNRECKGKWSSSHLVGENAAHWKGGEVTYYGPNWHAQKRAARQRDGWCQHCGKTPTEGERALDVHHIRPFRSFGYVPEENDRYLEANNLSNLICLCVTCHMLAEHGKIAVQPKLI